MCSELLTHYTLLCLHVITVTYPPGQSAYNIMPYIRNACILSPELVWFSGQYARLDHAFVDIQNLITY